MTPRLAPFLLLLPMSASADPLTFDYQDPKGISAVSLTLDSMLEPIVGYAKGISGTVRFDPAHPERSTGELTVDVDSVQFAHEGYTATARNYALDGKRWPKLTLKIRRVERIRPVGKNAWRGVVLADFTCRGVTRPKRLEATATYWPGRAEERTNGMHQGDLLVLRTRFSISRKEHGISEGIPDEMVGDTVEVGVSVVGTHITEPKVARRWRIEVQDRDDPMLAHVEEIGDRLRITIRSETQTVSFRREAGEIAFSLPDSKPVRFTERNGEVTGTLGDLQLKGRAVDAFPAVLKPEGTGTGFSGLDLAARMARAGTTGMAVARIAGGKVGEVGYFGHRCAGGPAVDGDTLFLSGTMGLPALHLAATRLVVRGQLDPEAYVNALLGSNAIAPGPQGWGDQVTVRDLLRGTTGLPLYKFAGDLPGADPAPVGPITPGNRPGEREGISAYDDWLLEQVVARATGRPAADVVRDEVFVPLGLTRSTYAYLPDDAATPHYSSGEPTLDPYHRYGLESGLWTTAPEWATLVAELGHILAGRPNRPFTQADVLILAQLNAEKSRFGVRRKEDGTGYYLGGDPYGFFCEFFLDATGNEGVVVLQNRMMAWPLCNEVRDLVLGGGQRLRLFCSPCRP